MCEGEYQRAAKTRFDPSTDLISWHRLRFSRFRVIVFHRSSMNRSVFGNENVPSPLFLMHFLVWLIERGWVRVRVRQATKTGFVLAQGTRQLAKNSKMISEEESLEFNYNYYTNLEDQV